MLDFCLSESFTLLSIRLEKLCHSNCEDLALVLVKTCVLCVKNSHLIQSPDWSKCVVEWQDLLIALLYKDLQNYKIIDLLKQYSFEDGEKLVKRFITRASDQNKSRIPIWMNSLKIAELANQCFITSALCLCPPPNCMPSFISELIQIEHRLELSKERLVEMLRTLIKLATLITSDHMYIFCSALFREVS